MGLASQRPSKADAHSLIQRPAWLPKGPKEMRAHLRECEAIHKPEKYPEASCAADTSASSCVS